MGTKIGQIKREKGMLYYVDGDGNVMKTPMKRKKKAAKKAVKRRGK